MKELDPSELLRVSEMINSDEFALFRGVIEQDIVNDIRDTFNDLNLSDVQIREIQIENRALVRLNQYIIDLGSYDKEQMLYDLKVQSEEVDNGR